MEMTVYYTCLNNECEKHRNIFVDGDPQHRGCERERLYLEGQRKPGVPSWVLFAAPVALLAGVAAYVLMARMRSKPQLREGRTTRETWSGSYAQEDDRSGHPVPPPIR